jgi:hypothetical protein
MIARIWRWRIKRHEARPETWDVSFMDWKQRHPKLCMYCTYTNWCRTQNIRLPIRKHPCVENLPRARIL